MTVMTTTKGRDSDLSTLPEISLAQTIQFLAQPTTVDVSDTLVALWAESTPEHAEDAYAQQARILAAILGRHVNVFTVVNAMEAIGNIHSLETGACVTEMYGAPNTDHERDRWLDYEQQNLTLAVRALGGVA